MELRFTVEPWLNKESQIEHGNQDSTLDQDRRAEPRFTDCNILQRNQDSTDEQRITEQDNTAKPRFTD